MFGNVKPFKPEMRVKEYEAYKSVYCAVCKTLGKDYGVISRTILSFDITFFALVALSVKSCEVGAKKGRCACNPLKSCIYCTGGEDIFHLSAAMSVILFYYKLKDNIADDGFFHRLTAYMLLPFAAVWRARAKKKYSDIDACAARMLSSQLKIERDTGASVDAAAEPTALMLSDFASALDEKRRDELARFGYHLGRWIYLVDALDDIDSDRKKGRFNPFLNIVINDGESLRDHANAVINLAAAELVDSYIELDIDGFSPIIENTIMLGLRESQKRAYEKGEKK